MSDAPAAIIEQAHARDAWAARFAPHTFAVRESTDDDPRDPYAHCSYCGSTTLADMLVLMKTRGVRWSASDWKYGWPHKFYVDVPCEPHPYPMSYRMENGKRVDVQMGTRTRHHLKFYTTHLLDAGEAELAAWNADVAPIVGVIFWRDTRGELAYQAEKGAPSMHGVIA